MNKKRDWIDYVSNTDSNKIIKNARGKYPIKKKHLSAKKRMEGRQRAEY